VSTYIFTDEVLNFYYLSLLLHINAKIEIDTETIKNQLVKSLKNSEAVSTETMLPIRQTKPNKAVKVKAMLSDCLFFIR
jgi:hypothetical protein